jgi:AraC-like DNA-binding protein
MTVLAPTISVLWQQIEDYGLDPKPLFKKYGVDPAIRFDTNARVSSSKIDLIRAEAAQHSKDPFFGLREGEYTRPSHIGALGFAWLASTSLQSAFARLQRYIKVIHDKMVIETEQRNGVFVVAVESLESSAIAFHRDSADLAVLAKMCRHIYGDKWNPVLVTLKHPTPSDTSLYFSYFRCPVEFNSKKNSLHIDQQQAQKRLSGSNKQLAQLNDHIVVRYLASLNRDDIINQVKSTILARLGEGGVTESCVAETLHTSTRNLNRKLAKDGTNFKNLLIEIRTELAEQYIHDESLTLTEISYMLGFSEISSFSRAYRRWTGHSPSEARKLHS